MTFAVDRAATHREPRAVRSAPQFVSNSRFCPILHPRLPPQRGEDAAAFVLEGPPCDEYFAVRDVLYAAYTMV